MMMNPSTKNIEVFKIQIENIYRDVSFEVELCKVEQRGSSVKWSHLMQGASKIINKY